MKARYWFLLSFIFYFFTVVCGYSLGMKTEDTCISAGHYYGFIPFPHVVFLLCFCNLIGGLILIKAINTFFEGENDNE